MRQSNPGNIKEVLDSHVALGRIAQWIEANGYRIAGPYREIGVELPSAGLFDDMTVEVHMPLERMNTSSDILFAIRE